MMLCSYVECTSVAIQALTAFKKLYPGHRREEVERCIEQAALFIEKIQETDGSWFVLLQFSLKFPYLLKEKLVLFFCLFSPSCPLTPLHNMFGEWGRGVEGEEVGSLKLLILLHTIHLSMFLDFQCFSC